MTAYRVLPLVAMLVAVAERVRLSTHNCNVTWKTSR